MQNDQWTPNQVIAHNLRRARNLHGWTQEAAAEKLEPYLGQRWSRVVFSAAERSTAGERIRQFSADDVVAFAAAFELPISFFFIPPHGIDRVAAHGARETLTSERLIDLATGAPDLAMDLAVARFDELEATTGLKLKRDTASPIIMNFDIRGER